MRLAAQAEAYGLPLEVLLVVVLAAAGAVDLAVLLVEGVAVSAFVSAFTTFLAIAIASEVVAVKSAAQQFQSQADSYRQMLTDYFMVSKADAGGHFCDANDNLLKRTGYTLDELKSQPVGGLSAGVYSNEYLEAMWSTVQSGQTWSGEFCDRAKDGSYIWVRAIVIPWRNARGELESLTTIGVDVTEQRSAELKLKRAHGTLEAFIKHAPAAVAMFDTEMHYVAHTDRWLQDYNLSQKSVVGLNHYDVFPEIPTHWKAKHQRILAGATERCDEERFQRADGSENILRWEVRPWYMPDASIGGVIMLTEEISERKKIEDQLWSLAKLDSLTGLPNRLLFNETLRDAIASADESGSNLGVALLDLDHFKEINDTLGHDAGDEVLKIVAHRLQGALGGAGTVSRLGGDEFAVLLLGHGSDDDIFELLADIKAALAEPMNLAGTLRSCSASIGVTIYPRDAAGSSDLLKNADLALYRAKSYGRGRTDVFSPDLRASIDRLVELQESALEAIQRDEFTLFFQPIVPCDPAEPTSFEALLRWRNPVHGVLAPGSFEEIFENPNVAVAIGDRVMDLALAQAAAWQADGLEFGRVAVNVTSADFAFGSLADRLKTKLDAHGVAADKVCIEVTERVFLDSRSTLLGEALLELDALGVEIALDDFGTGYASLSHIKAYPIGRLKVDRSFVMDMQDNTDNRSIVQAIVQLGRSMGLRTTAEGVEDDAQVALLRSLGCGSLQGYYFSRPLPAADVRRFLRPKRQQSTRVA